MSSKEREIIYLEFVDGLLRLFQFRTSSAGSNLEKFYISACPSLKDAKALNKSIDDLFLKLDYADQELTLIMPDKGCAQRYLKLPTVDDEELSSMLVNHSQHYVPYALDELSLAYNLVKRDEQGYSDVLCLMYAKEEYQLLIKLLLERDIKLSAIYLKPMAFASLVAQKKAISENQEILVLYKEHQEITVMIMRGEKLALYRKDDANKTEQQIKSFIFDSLSLYIRSSSAGPVSELYILGDFKKGQELCDYLNREFTMNVESLDIETWTRFPNSLNIKSFSLNCAPIFALAQDKLYHGLNLLPEELRAKKQLAKIIRRRFSLQLLWLLLCSLFIIVGAFKGFKLKSALNELEAESLNYEVQAEELRIKESNLIWDNKSRNGLYFDIEFFHLLHSSLSRGVEVEKLATYKRDRRYYQILAKAETRDQVYDAVDVIKESEFFAEDAININYLTSIEDRGKERFTFELILSREIEDAVI